MQASAIIGETKAPMFSVGCNSAEDDSDCLECSRYDFERRGVSENRFIRRPGLVAQSVECGRASSKARIQLYLTFDHYGQVILASLLASAIAATLVGRLVNNAASQGRWFGVAQI
jgi:hypothetical protein